MNSPNVKESLHQPSDPFCQRVENQLTAVPKTVKEILKDMNRPVGVSRADIEVVLDELRSEGKAVRFWDRNHQELWREA